MATRPRVEQTVTWRRPGGMAAAQPVAAWQRPRSVAPEAVAAPAGRTEASTAALGLPFTLFCVYTFVMIARPQEYVSALIPLRLALVFTALTTLATVIGGLFRLDVLRMGQTRVFLLLYAVMIAGIPFAIYRPGSFDFVFFKYAVNVAFFILFVIHVNTPQKLKRVIGVLVISTFVFTVFGLLRGDFYAGRYFAGNLVFDPNDVAFVEVSLLVFPLWAVLAGSYGPLIRTMAMVTLPLGVLLTLYTGSRGGALALGTLVVGFLFVGVKGVSKLLKITVVAAVVAAVAFSAGEDRINVERYSTLGSLETDYNFREGGRWDIWVRGLQLFAEDPITGVGVSGFENAIGSMRAQEAGVIPVWQTAHSAYVQILTELGIFGIILFLLLLAKTMWTFFKLRNRPSSPETSALGVLAGLLVCGFAAQLVSVAFLSQAYSVFLTLAFALAAALTNMTASPVPPSPAVVRPGAVSRPAVPGHSPRVGRPSPFGG